MAQASYGQNANIVHLLNDAVSFRVAPRPSKVDCRITLMPDHGRVLAQYDYCSDAGIICSEMTGEIKATSPQPSLWRGVGNRNLTTCRRRFVPGCSGARRSIPNESLIRRAWTSMLSSVLCSLLIIASTR